jgi:antibiotic biosynthesis monooxygenase (ABM) superfamily enzyme
MREIRPLGLFAVWLHVAPEQEEEFNAWYNTEHIQQITSIPGFINGRRYMALEGVPKYLALYELHDETVTAGQELQRILANPTPWSARMRTFYQEHRIRNTYRLIFTAGEAPDKEAPYLYVVKTDIPAAIESDFNNWYDQEHVPALATVPGCFRARRFLAVEGQPKYMAVYDIEPPEVIQSTAWTTARDTAWTDKILPHMQGLQRRVYQLILPAK